ncbi:Peptidase S8 domain-containing protein [Forsythia ovata]|uniref:Peptidase S8 domain-containing protein n=1 Tax=Forsythia ovata TaxID=205694 RepID=A0ABD1XA32_9LAMI
MYKVGWIFGDISSIDVLKAFDEAIHNGVDVLSLSLGYDLPLYLEVDKHDVIYYGLFHAVASGITIICHGENSGLDAGKISNVVSWFESPNRYSLVYFEKKLEYPGVSPELSFLKDIGHAEFYTIIDEEALQVTGRGSCPSSTLLQVPND